MSCWGHGMILKSTGHVDPEATGEENAVHLLPPYACELAGVGMRDPGQS